MSVRAMDKVGAGDVALGQVWAQPPGERGNRRGTRPLWRIAVLGSDGATLTPAADPGLRPGNRLDVSFGALLAEWTLVGEAR